MSWFNKDTDQRIDKLTTKVETLENMFKELEAKFAAKEEDWKNEKKALVTDIHKKSAELKRVEEENADLNYKKNSDEPWIEIRALSHSQEKGFKIDLDWNEAFIHRLKDSDITGDTEHEIIQTWLAFLYQDIVEKMEKEKQKEPIANLDDSEYV